MFSYVAPGTLVPKHDRLLCGGGDATSRLQAELRRVVLAYRIALGSARVPVASFVAADRLWGAEQRYAAKGCPSSSSSPTVRSSGSSQWAWMV